ncbi:hypothetical protein [Metabacillus halosaccharovorans]|uniref:hypothetical protein n=1 Tax=Metabacillus halosaccharovorans TaxID=930124 RepID=UPI001C1F373C|nr:hypothetical protein [Metabacillus halosaccharovorans]MBU7595274.1 hypothetical protein [Metabacillus halosaccharovorans]MCM3439863.1 hypothetical protein [Metabacillus halosaccharovorans]
MDKNMSNQFFFLVIHSSSIKTFLITDLLVSTCIYYGLKMMSHNEWISIIGCLVGTETYKRILTFYRKACL